MLSWKNQDWKILKYLGSIRKVSEQEYIVAQGHLLDLGHKVRNAFQKVMRSGAQGHREVSNKRDLWLGIVVIFLSCC